MEETEMNMDFKRKLPIPMDIKAQYPFTPDLEAIKTKRDEEIKEILQFYGSDLIIQQLKIEKKSPFYSTIKKQLKKHLNYEI